ncbi:YbaB/EbfC family nucleoid-associated protein [Candidatus Viridilinea mediisalina]|uniref:Nucleoid-associated protein CJ255_09050 n=1 Tax=Candidatus Viridilinea mediisalina TaxID=2024553 RepID=A0A2A6RJU6_9CHLR|nr:YbaB/EbfC family nucleoid-associated protein [Candidatus Viridilinea mediisalina]PDW03394.1 YbaB/EbfC family nucleoid-associated protein [Candidatus Viridilinea mediisalina]
MNPRQLQQMAQQMQRQMQKIQEELGEAIVEGTAGGGAITVQMNGHREIKGVTISPEVVDPNDVEMLQDLLLAAFSDATKRAQDLAEERMGPLMGGMKGMPGLF